MNRLEIFDSKKINPYFLLSKGKQKDHEKRAVNLKIMA
jgi:hypothetical protein